MGKPDALDRLVQFLIALAALFSIANGGIMVWDPHGWYLLLPTVQATGAFNQHFIRDIGLAYLTCGMLLGYAARFPSGRWLAALAGVLWLTLHGAFHVWELFSGVGAQHVFWIDAPGVLGPPLMVWIALGILMARQRIAPAGIPKSLFLRAIDKLSPGESAYIHEVANVPGHALEKLTHFMPATMHRYAAPADLFHMARIGATLIEDCGPCALTAARGALDDDVSRDLVNAALASKPLEGDKQTAFDFGQAIARQSTDALMLGEAIEAKYGRTVRLELAMTAATVRAYPGMKRGLGLTTACSITKLEV
ncbi:MAG TPA: hypothetical protein VNZ02_10595 [Steroidobacteraceae bacterium]|nr:hypothetical protein [Steroidobacteraceae bacterium]